MLKIVSDTEQIANSNRRELTRIDQIKISREEFEKHVAEMVTKTRSLGNQVDDVYNRSVETEIYLEKYLPYNTFVK